MKQQVKDSGVRMPLTFRLDANLGYVCNNNCMFCYFKHRKDMVDNPSTSEVKRRLSLIRQLGIKTVELTGGEPTIREDILELISYAKKEMGFENISIITNGSRFCDESFASKAIDAGVDDVLVSIHGNDGNLHDKLTGRGGSFQEAVKTVKNVLQIGATCRTNTVVSKLNYTHVTEIAKTICDLGVREANYIFFSPLDDATSLTDDLMVEYSKSAPHMKEMIDSYKNKMDTLSVKVIPFCFMDGYEDYVTDLYQNSYDPYEWDYYNRVKVRRGTMTANAAALAGMILFMNKKHTLKIGFKESLREGVLRVETYRHCIKPKACKECKYEPICPGMWKHYNKRFGLQEVKPIPGDKIYDIDTTVRKRFLRRLSSPN